MAYGFIPMAWRQVKVTFIPKPGTLYYAEAKAYHPISLSHFLWETMEKLVDTHIKEGTLRTYPQHRNQHAYQTGKSTETAIYSVVTRIENAIEQNDIALGALFDTEGAFDRTSFDIIKPAAGKDGIDPAICRRSSAMLESRTIAATLSGETLGSSAFRGCPQGGVLSPPLWALVVDYLLWELNDDGHYTVGYAVGIEILKNGELLSTVSERLQTALYMVQRWCERTSLSISPNKTILSHFLSILSSFLSPFFPLLYIKILQVNMVQRFP
jgi:hypothetical protein